MSPLVLQAAEEAPLNTASSRGIVGTGLLMLTETDSSGMPRPVQHLGPGDPFGASLGPADRLVALSASSILMFDMPQVSSLLTESPELAAFFAAAEREELRRAEDRVLMLGARKITTRLAALVVQLWCKGGGDITVELPLPRAELAAYLGGRVETVSRAVTELRNDGCLRFLDRGRIEILNPGRLAELAEVDLSQAAPRDWMAV